MDGHEAKINATIWSSREPADLLHTLCRDIGPRVPSSHGMLAGQECLRAALGAAGAHTIVSEPVPLPTWRESTAELQATSPRRRSYACVQHVNSAAADVTAPLFALRSTSEEEMDREAGRIRGSIVMLPGHEISGVKFTPLPMTLDRLVHQGAVGALTRSRYVEGYPSIELVRVGSAVPIPAMGITDGDARELDQFLTRGAVCMNMKTGGRMEAAECSNIVAELGGSSDEIVILGAHCDSFYLNPGALDNLTGVLTLVETVRALAPLEQDFKRTLRIVIYTGEEYGFWGSRAYIDAHRAELDRHRFVFNMDTLWPATAEGIAVMWSPQMRDYLEATLAATTRCVDVRNLFCMSSDYLSFMLQGIPAARPADFRNSMPPWSHTALDTADKIDPDWMRLNASVHAQLLARMLTDPAPLPAERLVPEVVEERLKRVDATEEIRSLGYSL